MKRAKEKEILKLFLDLTETTTIPDCTPRSLYFLLPKKIHEGRDRSR